MNKLTPGSNMMWESSRMMLPEHKARIRKHQKDLQKKEKPILDDQQKLGIDMKLQLAIKDDLTVGVKYFKGGDFLTVKEKLGMIDTIKIKLRDGTKIPLNDVLNVYIDQFTE